MGVPLCTFSVNKNSEIGVVYWLAIRKPPSAVGSAISGIGRPLRPRTETFISRVAGRKVPAC